MPGTFTRSLRRTFGTAWIFWHFDLRFAQSKRLRSLKTAYEELFEAGTKFPLAGIRKYAISFPLFRSEETIVFSDSREIYGQALDLLVPVSLMHRCTYTPGLSTT